MKIAVFGGSFNPVHSGHAMLAETVIKELGYDKVLFVPTFIPPHKVINCNVSPNQRLSMLKEFCNSYSDGCFEAEPCEIERKGVSYTSDTLEYLTEKYKSQLDGKLAFIMGDEIAAEFDKWHEPEKIVELADLIITHRYPDIKAIEKNLYGNTPSNSFTGDFSVKFNPAEFKYPCIYLENPVLPVSSSDIRGRIKEGRSYRYLVPASVYDFIEKNNLYKNLNP